MVTTDGKALVLSGDADLGNRVVQQLEEYYPNVSFAEMPCDISKIDSTTHQYTKVGNLLCMVLIMPQMQGESILNATYENWRNDLVGGLDVPLFAIQKGVSVMLEQPLDGLVQKIVLVVPWSSAAEGKSVAEDACVWGLRGFARHAALNLAQNNILVNTVSYDPNSRDSLDEIAATVGFLVSAEADNITGMTLPVSKMPLQV